MSISSIDRIKSNINEHGLLFNNRFMLHISTPPGFIWGGDIPAREIAYNCTTINVPGYGFVTEDIKPGMLQRKVPYEPIFLPINATIRCSADMIERQFFDDWHRTIFDEDSSLFKYPIDYFSDISITVFDSTDTEVYSVRVAEAYPINVGDISMDYSGESIATFDVEFTYLKVIERESMSI